jgi:type VI secretion system secreted protein Hcp
MDITPAHTIVLFEVFPNLPEQPAMKSILATLVGATLLAAVPAQAANDLYLNIAGIKGESTVKGYEGANPVLAWSWGLSSTSTALGGPGKLNLQDLSWTQYLDSGFIDLYANLTTVPQPQLGKATLYAERTGLGGYNYFQAIFDGNYLSSMSTGGSGGEDRFTANFTMSMTSVTLRYLPTKGGTWAEATFTQAVPGGNPIFSGDPQTLRGLSLALASPVPEPASWALMLGGVLLTGAALRRRLPS